MKIISALSSEIADLKQPAVTGYQVGLIMYRLYLERKYKGQTITNIKKETPTRGDYNRYTKELLSYGLLNSDFISHNEIFGVLTQGTPSAEEIACCVDPFVYVSHLSAMEYHGLTDRFSKILFLSTPKTDEWSRLAQEKMEKDLGENLAWYRETGLPKLKKLPVKNISKKTVSVYTSTKYTPGAYVNVKGQFLRVSSIGRTFFDMLRNPSLCGGIYHVLDVYEESAKRYLKLIVNELERHGSAIDKVRAGYVLEERLGLSDPCIEGWKEHIQRGGSRKLVADEPYKPVFSDNWCLSINIEERGD
jgi:predicted transcriptional regulator of viral defense system